MLVPKEKNTNIEVLAEEEKKFHLLGKYQSRIDGGRIFEYSIKDKTLVEATYKYTDTIELGVAPKKELMTRPECIYIEALNRKNAMRRLFRGKVIFKT